MHTLKTLIVALFLTVGVSAQEWIDLGIKAGYGPTILLNTDIFASNDINHTFSYGLSYGGKVGYNFSAEHQLTGDFIISNFNQKFKESFIVTEDGASPEYNSQLSFRSTMFYLMYRHNVEGSYFEIGPYMARHNRVNFSHDLPYEAANFHHLWLDKSAFGASMGFGSYILGTENFGITAGARLSYQLTDLVSDLGKRNNFPMQAKSEAGSFPLIVQFVIEANFDFAYMAHASCGKKKMLTF